MSEETQVIHEGNEQDSDSDDEVEIDQPTAHAEGSKIHMQVCTDVYCHVQMLTKSFFICRVEKQLHAAFGHCVSDLEFNQLKMRSHLFKCLAARNFTPFPILDECSKEQRKLCIQNISVYCTCLMPDTFGDMIQCETCHKWFHAKCLGLLTLPNCNEKWYCSSCH